jgi:superfamily II DNA or RNA helicase
VTRQVLRDYQTRWVADVEREWARGVQRVAGVLPTGGGKTTCFVETAERWLERNPGRRVVAFAHRTELVEQAAARVKAHTGLAVGIVKASLNQTRAPIVVASVQTLASREGRRARMIPDVGLAIVDECHRAAARTYREALATFGCMGEGGSGLALGVTATLSRSDRLSLGAVWQSVVEGPTIMEMIGRGWLVRPRGLAVRVEDMDLRSVRIVAGEYRKEDLGEALVQSLAPKRIAEAYREHAADRPGIVFAPTVASAEAIMEALRGEGFTAELVHGGTPPDERREIIGRYRRRETQILCNCSVFTEGTDLPLTSCVVIARKTRHNGPYIQMAGRGLRTSPETGKTDCLILDVVGVTREHRLQAQIDLFGDDYGFDREQDEREVEELEAAEDAPEVEPFEFEVTVTGGGEVRGVLVADPVDLFHGAAVGWSRTQAGAWFLSTRERFLVVLPTTVPGAWGFDVWSVPKDVTQYWQPVAMAREDLNEARVQAEACVTSGERVSQRASWRRTDPSPAMMKLAMRLGIDPGFGTWSAGELSAEIDRVQASRRIDPHLPASMFVGI